MGSTTLPCNSGAGGRGVIRREFTAAHASFRSGGIMSKRVIAAAGLAAALIFALAAPAANASSGSPPLPVSTNGHKVQLVASGLKTPTSFAFGDGRIFVGDGGNSEG